MILLDLDVYVWLEFVPQLTEHHPMDYSDPANNKSFTFRRLPFDGGTCTLDISVCLKKPNLDLLLLKHLYMHFTMYQIVPKQKNTIMAPSMAKINNKN